MTVSPTTPGPIRPETQDQWGTIAPVDEARQAEAIRQLVAGSPDAAPDQARRFLDFARENRIDLDAMWVRLDHDGRIRATVLAVPNPGRTAMVFASPLRHRDAIPPLATLIAHVGTCLDERADRPDGLALAQVLLDPGHELERQLFLAAGFGHLADLSYLERPLPGARLPEDPTPDGVELLPYTSADRDRLIEILDASYEQTLDCPGLLGLRRTEDVLRGHMSTGEFDPSLWTIMLVDGRPGGALLLNPSTQGRCVELVYLGLAPFARGRGLGRHLLRHGLRLVQPRRERLITLAVDEHNAPALALYRREGFKRLLRRVALIRPIRSPRV